MGYRFYENWTAEQKAVVHREDCGHCNFGKGCHDNPLGDKNGRWSERFETLDQAKQAAYATGRTVRIHRCVDEST